MHIGFCKMMMKSLERGWFGVGDDEVWGEEYSWVGVVGPEVSLGKGRW